MSVPELRSGPPWVMEEMIASEPDLAAAIVGRDGSEFAELGVAVRGVAAHGEPVAVVGCGTSEHAAMAVAELLAGALPGARIAARQAFEAALDPWATGLCLAISHEGETAATLDALRSARAAGAASAIITAAKGSAGARLADTVLVTPQVDRSWCHTVGYLSPIVAGATVAASMAFATLQAAAVRDRVHRLLALRAVADGVGRALATASRYVIVGSGVDRIGARELALKIEEGVRRPAVGRDLETQLHGHLASADAECGLICLVVEPRGQERRARRTGQLLLAADRLRMPTAVVVAADADTLLEDAPTSAGRIVLPGTVDDVPQPFGAMLDGAIALQLLTLGLVHAAGVNPDLIRREEAAYREAAALAEAP